MSEHFSDLLRFWGRYTSRITGVAKEALLLHRATSGTARAVVDALTWRDRVLIIVLRRGDPGLQAGGTNAALLPGVSRPHIRTWSNKISRYEDGV